MKNLKIPSQKYLNTILKYDEKSPTCLIWLDTRHNKVKIGSVAGSLAKAYRKKDLPYYVILINGITYKCHRIIWKLFNDSDEIDKNVIDHIDRNTLNNKIENLRLVDISKNSVNKKLLSNNSSGFVGISWYKPNSRWRVYVAINKKQIILGYFVDIDVAIYTRIKYMLSNFNGFCDRELDQIRLQKPDIFDKITTELNLRKD